MLLQAHNDKADPIRVIHLLPPMADEIKAILQIPAGKILVDLTWADQSGGGRSIFFL